LGILALILAALFRILPVILTTLLGVLLILLITLLHVSGSVLTISLPAVGTLLVRIRFVFSGLLALGLILGACLPPLSLI
jgi:hypothetical protein